MAYQRRNSSRQTWGMAVVERRVSRRLGRDSGWWRVIIDITKRVEGEVLYGRSRLGHLLVIFRDRLAKESALPILLPSFSSGRVVCDWPKSRSISQKLSDGLLADLYMRLESPPLGIEARFLLKCFDQDDSVHDHLAGVLGS